MQMSGGDDMEKLQDLTKTGKLKDGTEIILRPMTRNDRESVGDFFGRMTPSVLQYVRNEVSDPKVLDQWFEDLNHDRVFPLLAFKDNKVVANATLHRVSFGWRKHLGTLRIVVDPELHGKGLGTLMINELIELAQEFGLEKLMVELPLRAQGALAIFKKAGFSPRAVIEGLMKDRHGQNLDIVIMVMDVAVYANKAR
jgi:L-amino acid N-acyltransferase YncA